MDKENDLEAQGSGSLNESQKTPLLAGDGVVTGYHEEIKGTPDRRATYPGATYPEAASDVRMMPVEAAADQVLPPPPPAVINNY